MLVITRHRVPGAAVPADADAEVAFPFGTAHPLTAQARHCLEALAERPGFVRGWVGRAADEPGLVVLTTEWDDVGSWRRALSPVDVRVAALPFLGTAIDEPTAFIIDTVAGTGAVDDATPPERDAGQ